MSSVNARADQARTAPVSESRTGSALAEEGLKRWSRVVKDAWADDALKQQLLENPRPVLEQYGLKTPPGLDVRVVENTDRVVYLTLPADRALSGDLTLDQLDQVVGGTAVEYAVMLALIIVVCITA